MSEKKQATFVLLPGDGIGPEIVAEARRVLDEDHHGLDKPKRRILEIYLNIAELGPGMYGVGAASRHYFGKVRPARPAEPAGNADRRANRPGTPAGGGNPPTK